MRNLCIILALICACNKTARSESYCYSSDSQRSQSSHYGTKTAYINVKGSFTTNDFVIKGCVAEKLWLISRHGTRYPGVEDLEGLRSLVDIQTKIKKNYESKSLESNQGDFLCENDLNLIKNWQLNPNIVNENESMLADQGWIELRSLAKDYKSVLNNLLPETYSKEEFTFVHTRKQRTEASYQSFVEGLFGDKVYEQIVLPPIPDRETLLKPYSYCKLWEEEQMAAEKNDRSQFVIFKKSHIYQQLIKDVSNRLKFSAQLLDNEIDAIWNMCRFDQALSVNDLSSWCAAFTPDQVNLLEYAQDLKYYYQVGNGSRTSTNLSCEVFSNMLKFVEDPSNHPKLVAYFTHSNTINIFLTALEAFVDETPLMATDATNKREFSTSKATPFASNLAAVKYKCTNKNEIDNRVAFWLNQKLLKLNWCNGENTCDKQMYQHFLNGNCDEIFCQSFGYSLSNSVGSAILIIALILLILI